MYLKLLLQVAFFSSKMHQILFSGRLPPGPPGELTVLPKSPSWIKGSLLLNKGVWEGGEERGEEGTRRGSPFMDHRHALDHGGKVCEEDFRIFSIERRMPMFVFRGLNPHPHTVVTVARSSRGAH